MKKLLSLMLSLCLLLSCGLAGAETVKHERVYAVLDAAGEVRSLTDSIRLENQDALDVLTDRTMLTAVENVGGQETFTLNGEEISFQAAGKDITYQGTSDKALPVVPALALKVDGAEAELSALKDLTGKAELTVSYDQPEAIPFLAASVLLMPEEVTNITVDHGQVVSFNGSRAVAGIAFPGAPEKADLPSSFTVKFTADHAALNWMMTFASAEPADQICQEIESRLAGQDADQLLADATTLMTALQNGEELPELSGALGEAAGKITELNSALTQLDDGASALSAGASTLSAGMSAAASGVSDLTKGLNELTANNSALNQGAQSILDALLTAANGTLASAGLDAMGVTVPELTGENFAEVLEGLISQLTAVKDLIPGADEFIAQLTALEEQLTQVQTFVSGLKEYTGGVTKAATGATLLNLQMPKLDDGAQQLADGASQLQSEGTGLLKQTLLDAEKSTAEKALPLLESDAREILDAYETTRDQAAKGGYDLRAEDGSASTVYIYRTDF